MVTAVSVPAPRKSHPRRFPVRAATSAPTTANATATGMEPKTADQVSPPVKPITRLNTTSTTVTPSSVQAWLSRRPGR